MVVRNCIQCDVCGAVTLVRVQIGFLEQHPIRYYCGHCKILISGSVNMVNDEVTLQFENGTRIEETDSHYYMEISPDLLTEKLQNIAKHDDPAMFISPFIKNLNYVGRENYLRFKEDTLVFLNFLKKEWPRIRRIIELYQNKKWDYLEQEIAQMLPQKQFPVNNELEYLRAVHYLFLKFYYSIIGEKFFRETTRFLWKETEFLAKNHNHEYERMTKHFEENGILSSYEKRIYTLLSNFSNIYKHMLPAISFSYSDKLKVDDVKNYLGISTSNFEDLKQFYIDSYEFLADTMTLTTAYNNIKYRSDYNSCVSKNGKVIDLEAFISMPKGNRLQFCDGNEVFDRLFGDNLDSKLRNAIGHNSYDYDGVSQIITFTVDNKKNKREMYLLEFTRICYEMFLNIIKLQELIYQTRKNYYVFNGYIPVSPHVFGVQVNHKIGRNEPCVCGSV